MRPAYYFRGKIIISQRCNNSSTMRMKNMPGMFWRIDGWNKKDLLRFIGGGYFFRTPTGIILTIIFYIPAWYENFICGRYNPPKIQISKYKAIE